MSESIAELRQKSRVAAGLLLAAACSGLMAPAANAAVITNESSVGDFPNTNAAATNLGAGVAVVNGSLGLGDTQDYFKVTGLTGGSAFSIPVTLTITSGSAFYQAQILNSSGSVLDQTSFLSSSFTRTLAGTVPADGILTGSMTYSEGNGGGNYSFSNIPEPASAGLLAAGALAALTARRRKPAIPSSGTLGN